MVYIPRDAASGRFISSAVGTPRVLIEVAGVSVVDRQILRVSERAKLLYPVYEALGRYLMHVEEEQFDTEGHGEWEPLAESTIARKASDPSRDPRILHESMQLRDSLTKQSDPNNILEFEPFFRFGTKVAWGALHQTGTVNMPQRKPIDLSELQRRFMMRAVQKWIVRGVVEV